MIMNKQVILGIDLGGTKISAGLVKGDHVFNVVSQKINPRGSEGEVLQQVFHVTDSIIHKEVTAIGIGIPGLASNGIAYDVYNIPSWKEVHLQKLMENRYSVPVLINNDSNCFALGEYYFGKGRGHDSMVGLTLGTGLGCGIIINRKLFTGATGGAGEFGMIPYKDKYLEYYASGQFFRNVYKTDGEEVFKRAQNKNEEAVSMYREFGLHFGNAINTILYTLDIGCIVIGGSVRHAYSLFSEPMWQQIHQFEFKRAVASLKIEISDLGNSAVLGAAALHYDL
jgi:glucokinase